MIYWSRKQDQTLLSGGDSAIFQDGNILQDGNIFQEGDICKMATFSKMAILWSKIIFFLLTKGLYTQNYDYYPFKLRFII